MSTPHLLVHDERDNVGVVVDEGVRKGTEMLCVITKDNTDFTMVAAEDVPLGHKIALADLKAGETIVKYGEDIGRATADITRGAHVHTHNLKTKRW